MKEDLDERTKDLIRKAIVAFDDAHYAIELAHEAVNDEMIDCALDRKDYSRKHEYWEDLLAGVLDTLESDYTLFCDTEEILKRV